MEKRNILKWNQSRIEKKYQNIYNGKTISKKKYRSGVENKQHEESRFSLLKTHFTEREKKMEENKTFIARA